MIKTLFAATAVFAFASTAAYSAEEKMACDDATVMKMEEARQRIESAIARFLRTTFTAASKL